MFGISETELVFIAVFGFLIFGPDKLPGMGRTLGRMLRQFREAQEGFTEVVQTEVMDPLSDVLNEPVESTKGKGKKDRAAALADDADIDEPAAGTAPKRETFAERKARLEAEREAAEEAEAEEESGETMEGDTADAGVADEPAEPDTSARALYALGTRKSGYRSESQRKADEAAAKAAAEAQAATTESNDAETADEVSQEAPSQAGEPEKSPADVAGTSAAATDRDVEPKEGGEGVIEV